MPTKRCEICRKAKQIEEKGICCSDCEAREFDLLMATYAFIHCSDSDYCPIHEVITHVPAIMGVKISQVFIRSWLLKNWLEKNEINSLRVPPPLYQELKDSGFTISDMIRAQLVKQKEKKVVIENIVESVPTQTEAAPRVGMIFMEKKKRGE